MTGVGIFLIISGWYVDYNSYESLQPLVTAGVIIYALSIMIITCVILFLNKRNK